MSSVRFITLVLLTLVSATPVLAASSIVTPDGSGDYPTLQTAVDASADGDTIVLGPGTFTGAGNTDVDSRGKALFVTSSSGAAHTVIDCGWSGRALYVHDNVDPFTILGIAFTKGRSYGERGGAVWCQDGSLIVTECQFTLSLACDGGAVAIVNSIAKVVRNRFDSNNCEWKDCVGAGGTGCTSGVRGGAAFCESSTASFVDNYFEDNAGGFGEGVALYATTSTVELVGNRFFRNRMFEGVATVTLHSCEIDVHANEFVENALWAPSGLSIEECDGDVRANIFLDNGGHLGGALAAESSPATLSFNYFRGNGGQSVSSTRSAGSITRNLIVETTASCCWGGSAIQSIGCEPQPITNNTLYQNGTPGLVHFGHEIIFNENPSISIERNLMVSDSEEPFISCDYYSYPCSSVETNGVVSPSPYNVLWGGFGDVFNPCNLMLDYTDPLLRDPANYNFFLKPASPCFADTTIGTIVVDIFQGALPKGNRPSGVAAITRPPDANPTGVATGQSYALNGFAITNDSPVDAVVNYRLIAAGGRLWDAGDATSLVGSTPVLAPGENFVPPAAAVIVPEGDATVTVAYCYAYAPALNLVDTVTTTVTFERPLSVRVSSFGATFETGGVRLRWAAVGDGLEGWHVYRSSDGSAWRRVNAAPIPSTVRDYLDAEARAGRSYRYQLVALQGGESLVGQVEIAPRVALSLDNAPNPFNPATTIRFAVPSLADVRLDIYGVDGMRIRTVLAQELGGGVYRREWDGRNDDGALVPSGVYFCRLAVGKQQLSRKIVLAR